MLCTHPGRVLTELAMQRIQSRSWSSLALALPMGLVATWAHAQEQAVAASEAAGPLDAAKMLIPYALMFVVVYFVLLRPSNKQRREQQAVLAGLKRDDEVLTQSGIVGRIVSLDETLVVLEVADRVKVRMLRDRIVGPYAKATPLAAKGA